MDAYRIVMVGTDGSESSFAAVEAAARLAAACGAELVIACAYLPMRGRELDLAKDQLGAEVLRLRVSIRFLRSARSRSAIC